MMLSILPLQKHNVPYGEPGHLNSSGVLLGKFTTISNFLNIFYYLHHSFYLFILSV